MTCTGGGRTGAGCAVRARRLPCVGRPPRADQGTDDALALGAGHSFVICLRDCYPINVLNAVKAVQEVCTIFCATTNRVDVVVARSPQGSGILGVIDATSPAGVEDEAAGAERMALLRRFRYKRG